MLVLEYWIQTAIHNKVHLKRVFLESALEAATGIFMRRETAPLFSMLSDILVLSHVYLT